MNTREQVIDLKQRVSASMSGWKEVVERLLVALLTNGSVLMEGPQVTEMTRVAGTMAEHVEGLFSHIRFEPDTMPSDVTGSEVWHLEEGLGGYGFQEGPVFGNLVLADGIDRASEETQAALLDAMEERQVTAGGGSHKLPELFMVVATLDAVGMEQGNPLPEASMDRFLMHILMHERDDGNGAGGTDQAGEVGPSEGGGKVAPIPQSVIFDARREVAAVRTSEAINLYFVDIISATRNPGRYDRDLARWIHAGAGARGTLSLDRAARAHAWLQGRDHVTVEDVRAIAADCLRHRIIPTHEACVDGMSKDDLLTALLKHVVV